MYHYTDGGLENVWLANGFEFVDSPHGQAIRFKDLDGLIRSICLAFANTSGKLNGTEFRYIRTSGLLLSQAALGSLLGIEGQTVARWEKSGRIPRWADQLIRLMYLAQADSQQPIAHVLERTRMVDQLVNETIIARSWRGQWKTTISTTESCR